MENLFPTILMASEKANWGYVYLLGKVDGGIPIQEDLDVKEIPNENTVTVLDMVAYAGNPGTLKAEGGRSRM